MIKEGYRYSNMEMTKKGFKKTPPEIRTQVSITESKSEDIKHFNIEVGDITQSGVLITK